MNREDIDWTILRGALITFFMCLLVGSALIGGSWYFKQEMLKNYKRSQAQFQGVSRQYLAVDEEGFRIAMPGDQLRQLLGLHRCHRAEQNHPKQDR